jgi:3-hydroxyacyl-CoA dehydrogenase
MTVATPRGKAPDATAAEPRPAASPAPPPRIAKVGVLGAGVMGAGIAAHVANAGVPVVLLDIVPAGATTPAERNALAAGAIEKLKKAKPAPLMVERNARLIVPGNLDDHLALLADCDWIVEAVLERTDVKQAVYRQVEAVRKPGSIVSSNTSTIPLARLVDGLPESFQRDFLITHFFNPPRYMRLLEVVAGERTRPEAIAAVRRFADVELGKTVVDCNDTPGFIANRIGTFWIEAATRFAIEEGLTVEEADLVAGKPMGFPKTGIFGLLDLVGIDLGPHIAASLLSTLPPDDAYREIHQDLPLLRGMIERGLVGRKGKGGFYRLERGAGGAKSMQAIDLQTGEYRPTAKARLASVDAAKAARGAAGLRALVEHPDRGGRFAWRMLSATLAYAASLVPAIADDVASVDQAMRAGYSWERGPFELLDQLGPQLFAERLAAEGRTIPPLLRAVTQTAEGSFYRVADGRLQQLAVDHAAPAAAPGYVDVRRPEGVLLLADVKRASQPVARNGSASLWDIGDGVLCLEFHTKMNALDDGVIAMVRQALAIVDGRRFAAVVVHNEAESFSVGAKIGIALFAANVAAWPAIEASIAAGQQTFKALKYAPFPFVGAPSGMALGGGCEILLHCAAVQAHAETYMGLVEVGVGVVPGWGGCKELLGRAFGEPARPGGPMPPVARVFETISTAKVSTSAEEARDLLFLRPTDGVTMNRDRLLADAKRRALELVAAGYLPPEPPQLALPGPAGRVALETAVDGFRRSGAATPHDAVVAKRLAVVVTGGDTDLTEPLPEDAISRLEREAFMDLIKTEGTLARIEHMLATGKPLRN